MSPDELQPVHGVPCPLCGARVGRGCSWFWGYSLEASHPERFALAKQFTDERRKLAEWNEASGPPPAEPEPRRT